MIALKNKSHSQACFWRLMFCKFTPNDIKIVIHSFVLKSERLPSQTKYFLVCCFYSTAVSPIAASAAHVAVATTIIYVCHGNILEISRRDDGHDCYDCIIVSAAEL